MIFRIFYKIGFFPHVFDYDIVAEDRKDAENKFKEIPRHKFVMICNIILLANE